MPKDKASAPTRRFATDQRCESQLAYLRHALPLAVAGRPVSYSTAIRRAVSFYTEHLGALMEAGQLDGLPGPHPQDADAERHELAEHRKIVDAAPPVVFRDAGGNLQPWSAAIRRNQGRPLPPPETLAA